MLDRATIVLLVLFVVGSPLSISVGSIAAGGLMLVGLGRLATSAAVRATVPRGVWIALVAWIGWTAICVALADPYRARWDTWIDESWIKVLAPLVAVAAAPVVVALGRVLRLYLATGALVAIYGAYQHFTGDQWFTDDWVTGVGDRWRAVGFYGHHLTYGGHVVCLWLLWLAHAASPAVDWKRPRPAIENAATGLLLSLGLLWSYARSAQLGAGPGALVVAFALPPARRRWALAAVALLAVATVATPAARDRFARVLDAEAEQTRPHLWEASLRGIAEHPITGYGPGNFRALLAEHEVEGLYESRAHSHNDLLMIAVNSGIPGALLFAVLQVTFLVALVRARRVGGEQGWIALAGVASIAALTLGGLFQVFQSDDEVELTLYFLIGCGLAVRRTTA